MTHAVPELSSMCTRSDHGRCPHSVGVRMPRPWRRQQAQLRLCGCACHAACALSGETAVPEETFTARCTCPGAERIRASFDRSREVRRIAAEVDMSDHPDAEEIESRLRAVFEDHGQAPPPGMTTWSRLIAAGTAARGTRVPRLLGMGARAVAHSVRWSHEPASSGMDSHNRSQARSGYRAVGIVAGVAMALTVAAAASRGPRRLLWAAAATLAWLASGYAVSLVTAVAGIARAAEARGRPQDLPSR